MQSDEANFSLVLLASILAKLQAFVVLNLLVADPEVTGDCEEAFDFQTHDGFTVCLSRSPSYFRGCSRHGSTHSQLHGSWALDAS